MNLNLYRAIYEWPRSGKVGAVTFAATPHEALPWAAGFVKFMTRGYLLRLVEVRPLAQGELELT